MFETIAHLAKAGYDFVTGTQGTLHQLEQDARVWRRASETWQERANKLEDEKRTVIMERDEITVESAAKINELTRKLRKVRAEADSLAKDRNNLRRQLKDVPKSTIQLADALNETKERLKAAQELREQQLNNIGKVWAEQEAKISELQERANRAEQHARDLSLGVERRDLQVNEFRKKCVAYRETARIKEEQYHEALTELTKLRELHNETLQELNRLSDIEAEAHTLLSKNAKLQRDLKGSGSSPDTHFRDGARFMLNESVIWLASVNRMAGLPSRGWINHVIRNLQRIGQHAQNGQRA